MDALTCMALTIQRVTEPKTAEQRCREKHARYYAHNREHKTQMSRLYRRLRKLREFARLFS